MKVIQYYVVSVFLLIAVNSASHAQAQTEIIESEISIFLEKLNKNKETLNSLLSDLASQEKDLIAKKDLQSREEYQTAMNVIIDKRSIVNGELRLLLKEERDYKKKNGVE